MLPQLIPGWLHHRMSLGSMSATPVHPTCPSPLFPHRSTCSLIGPRTPSSVHMLPHRSTYTLIGLTSAEVLLVDKHDAYLARGHYVHRRAVIDKARWASCNHEEAFLLNASKTTAGREPCGLLTGHNLASSVLRNSELQCRNNSVYLRMQAQT